MPSNEQSATPTDGLPVVENEWTGAIAVPEAFPASFYDDFLTARSKARLPSPIRAILPLENIPGIISLLMGKPNPEAFPITSFSFTARTPSADGTDPEREFTLKHKDLEEALQYGPTAGLPRLIKWLLGLQEKVHERAPGEDWTLTCGAGGQDLLYKAISALVGPGDSVLVEAPVYGGVIPLFLGQKCVPIEVPTDAQGCSSQSLREILESWPSEKPKPKLLYIVPYGCNPTGLTHTLERRREILALANEHNFLILEDDPYFYLYFSDQPRSPSYFKLDGQGPYPRGRVLRFDSLSKVLSAGLRFGFATGPARLIERINVHTAAANLQGSSTVQAIVQALLTAWGYDTYMEHTRRVASLYRAKRDVFERAMQKHLTGLAEWTPPEAGMFYWFKLLLPPSEGAPEGDSEALIRQRAIESGVLALPGTAFFISGKPTPYVRASFSLLPEKDVDEALRRLAKVVRLAQRGE